MTVSYKLRSAQGNAIHLKPPNSGSQLAAVPAPNVRCPHCMHMGAFTNVLQQDFQVLHQESQPTGPPANRGVSWLSIRVCPNNDCRGMVLIVADNRGKTLSLPHEVLDFDPDNIPPAIAASLEEAAKCHSIECYKAAALMVRRVLEELCEDRKATGGNLKERLASLSKIIVLPQALMQAADGLRLLGNDAAHIEATTYQSIGETEVRLAIDLAKELLKGAYQYQGLLHRLTALKKPM